MLTGDAASNTTSLIFADIDKNGKIDLVSGNKGQVNHLYLNTGTALGTATAIGAETDNTVALAVGDLNGDGYLDVVAVNAGQSKAYINTTLGTTVSWATAAANVGDAQPNATSGVLVDVNGDGTLDLVLGVSGAANRIYLNNGGTIRTGSGGTNNGVIVPPATVAPDSHVLTVAGGQISTADIGKLIEVIGARYRITAVADVTTNGITTTNVTLDRVVGANNTAAVWRIREWGASNMGAATTAFSTDTTQTQGLAVGDFDGDGKNDLVVVNNGSGDLNGIYFGDGTTFASPNGLGIVSFTVGAGKFLQVEGTGVDVVVLGQALHGDIQFVQSGTGSARTTSINISPGATLTFEGLPALSVNGSLLITSTGVAGRFHIGTTATPLVIGPATFSGALDLLINTTGAAVTLADATRLDAGPYLRISGTSISVTIGQASLTGDFSIEQTTNSLGQHRLAVGVANATISVGTTQLISNGQGALLILPAGIAGQLSGTISTAGLLPASIGIVGTFGIAINQTPLAVDETVTVGDTAIALDLPAGSYVRLFGQGVQISILGQTLSGNFSIEKTTTTTTLTADNVSLHIGNGTSDFVTLTNGHGTLTLNGAGTGISGTIAGTIAVNVPGITLTGTLQLQIDTTPGSPYLRVKGTGVSVTVLGQTLSGNFSFTQSGTGAARVTTLTADSVALTLGTASVGISLTGGAGSLTISSAGIVGTISGNVTATLPGFGASFHVDVQMNTTTSAAGPIPASSFRVSTTGLHLTVVGIDITGDFSFEQVKDAGPDGLFNTGDDTKVIKIAASGVGATLGSSTAGVTISAGTALLVITPAGLAGTVSAHADIHLGGGVSASGTVSVSINNTAAAVNEKFVVGGANQTLVLPLGPYLKVSVTGLSLNIQGQTLTGDLTFTKTATLTTVDFANVSLRLGTPTHDFVIVSNGSGHFDIGATGIKGDLTATIAVDIPNITVGGTFKLSIDTTTTPSPTLTVTATHAYLTVLGQKLTVESLTIGKDGATGVISVAVTNAELDLGNGTTTFLKITVASGSIVLKSTGVVASLTGMVSAPAFSSSDFSLTLPVSLDIDTTTTAPHVRVQVGTETTLANITILGQQLSGVFSFEQLTTSTGSKVVRIGLDKVHLFIGDPAPGGYGITVDNGSGSILITSVGIAGEIRATPTINLPFFSITGEIGIEFNRLSTPVNETFTFTDDAGVATTKTLTLQAGPFVRVAAYDIDLNIDSNPAIHGDFFFEQATRTLTGGGTQQVTKIGAANITFAGSGGGAITNARGALVILPTGIAGIVMGTASVTGGGFDFGASLGLGINTTPGAVHESVTVNGVVIPIDLDSTGITFIAQDLDFNFENLLEIHGNFQISTDGSFKATGLEIFVGKGPSQINGAPNPDAIGLLITNAAVSFQRAGTSNAAGTYALYAKGTLALVGLDGLQVGRHGRADGQHDRHLEAGFRPVLDDRRQITIPAALPRHGAASTSASRECSTSAARSTSRGSRRALNVYDRQRQRRASPSRRHPGLLDQRRRRLQIGGRGRLPPLELQGRTASRSSASSSARSPARRRSSRRAPRSSSTRTRSG